MQRRLFEGRGTLDFGSSTTPLSFLRSHVCFYVTERLESATQVEFIHEVALSKKKEQKETTVPFTSYIEIRDLRRVDVTTIIKQELSWRHHLVWGIGVVIFHRNKSRNLTGKLPISQASSYTPGAFCRAVRRANTAKYSITYYAKNLVKWYI